MVNNIKDKQMSKLVIKNNINSELAIAHADNKPAKSIVCSDIAVAVDTINDFPLDASDGDTVIVRDLNRGGTFIYDSSKVAEHNEGTNFNGWIRQYDGTVNVKWFGTKGDGIADDTNAIQNALNSVTNVYMPKGTYIISNTISLNQNNSLVGDSSKNTVIQSNFSGNAISVFTIESILIENIYIQLEKSNSVGIYAYNPTNSIFRNIWFNSATKNSTIGFQLNKGFRCIFENFTFNTLSNGLVCTFPGNWSDNGSGWNSICTFRNWYMSNVDKGIDWGLPRSFSCLFDTIAIDAAQTAFFFHRNATDFEEQITLFNCYTELNTNKAVDLYLENNIKIDNCKFTCSSGYALSIADTINTKVSNTILSSNDTDLYIPGGQSYNTSLINVDYNTVAISDINNIVIDTNNSTNKFIVRKDFEATNVDTMPKQIEYASNGNYIAQVINNKPTITELYVTDDSDTNYLKAVVYKKASSSNCSYTNIANNNITISSTNSSGSVAFNGVSGNVYVTVIKRNVNG